MTHFVLQATYPGPISAPALAPALDATVHNPWAPLVEQAANTSELGHVDWTLLDTARAADILDRERRTLLLRENDDENAIKGKLWNNLGDEAALLFVPADRTSPTDPRLRSHLERVLASMPAGAFGAIFATGTREP